MTVEGAIDRYADMVYRLALSQMKTRRTQRIFSGGLCTSGEAYG